ncbi:M4 family metallopeptidase [Chenggangzhangella methanolivorans]|uniref:M4 family metallopeptidase n=1 Tax=Chenggangzhangella methanolivorans TaxID=1437009 RepID=UPI003615135E
MLASKRVIGAAIAVALSSTAAPVAWAQSAGPLPAFSPKAAEVVLNARTGLVAWMSGVGGGPVASALGQGGAASFEQAAAGFLSQQSTAFGLRSGSAELSPVKTSTDASGRGFVRFQQTYKGVPIIGAELVVQVGASRDVMSASGRSVGDISVSTQPGVAGDGARKTAVSSTARVHGAPETDLVAAEPVLSIHDARVMGGPPAPPALVWRVDVTSKTREDLRQIVLVDAQNGRVAVTFNQAAHAAPANALQWVCDAGNAVAKVPCTQADAVSNPTGSDVPDVKLAAKFAESTYDFYARRFDRNSLDDAGLRLVSTVRFQRTAGQDYQNAFWSGDLGQMVYGKDFATAEDVVGHELSHGFTDFSSSLFYYYQSGALNESLSDIFGDLVQRSHDTGDGWLLGEDLPIGAIRNMKDPTISPNPALFPAQPDKMTSTLWTGDFSFRDQGGVHVNSGVGNKAAYLITDGDTFNGQTVKGLGIDKAAAIFYRVNNFILTSSSDYADFGNAMKQSCKDLIGSRPKNKKGVAKAAITADDCKEVAKAVTATEMSKDPQYWPIPAEAGVCPSGKTAKYKLFETFEATDTTSYKFQGSDFHWSVVDNYAASNFHALYASGGGQYDTNLASTDNAKIPAKAYLRFAHYYNLYTNSAGSSAGGVVEYSVNNGDWQRVPATMFKDNPYNTTIRTDTGSAFAGQAAFSGFSGGWTSSRIDLSSLSGKKVKFRFRMATDFDGAWDGWIIDDVRLYTCGSSKADVASAE